MGTIILIIAVIVEIAFAAYGIAILSIKARGRDIMRVGAFATFVLFTVVSIIEWSSRWYLLTALMFVWAVLVALTVTPALLFPPYQPPRVTGPQPVGTFTSSYTDQNRIETFSKSGGHREVNVKFWYPKDGEGKYPLVVFSPGAFGMKGGNASTFVELASHGYVVCAMDHPYHALFTRDSRGRVTTADLGFLRQVQNANAGKYDEATAFKVETDWMAPQVADIKFVLDTVVAQTRLAGTEPVFQRIDVDKIGLLGHSLGGESSAEVGRERNDISAVINLDADLHGEYVGFASGRPVINSKPYPVPILTFYSDVVAHRLEAIPDASNVIAVKHVAATAPKAFEVHLTGTDHMSFTDLPLKSPALLSLINRSVPQAAGHETDPLATIEKMNSIILAFFNTYLKGQGTFTYAGTY